MTPDRILIIEDSRLYRNVLKATLVKAGYWVDAAATGEEGVQKALHGHPDVVITDMHMPGMTGEEVCRCLKSDPRTQAVPIIMLTSSTTTDKVQQLDAGADDYLPKSDNFRELLAKVRVFLRIKHLQDRLRVQNEKLKYENEQNERELRMARRVQLGLLPQQGGRVGRLQFAFRYIPMRWLGGDLFDVLDNGDGRTVVFVSDVSGHGVSAALVTAMLKTGVLAYLGRDQSADRLAERLNSAIADLLVEGMFVTAFVGMLDANTGQLHYVNAGHPPALLVRRGSDQLEHLSSTELPLGVLRNKQFPAETVSLEPGDRLVLYTDGIIEASDAAGKHFGLSRLEQSVQTHRHKPLEQLVADVVQDLIGFCGRTAFDDDVNLVACEVTEP